MWRTFLHLRISHYFSHRLVGKNMGFCPRFWKWDNYLPWKGKQPVIVSNYLNADSRYPLDLNFSENQYNINEETISTFKARLAFSLVSTMANIWNEFILVLMNKISPFRAQNIITKTSLTRNVFTLLLAIN